MKTNSFSILTAMTLALSIAPWTVLAGDEVSQENTVPAWRKKIGLNYNSFFAGPGPGLPVGQTPYFTGGPGDTGLNFFNLVSLKYKFSERYAFDVQFRNQLVVTNQLAFRHQGQRFGISGKLLKGKDWVLAGALNSDLPLRPIMGQIGSDRTLLFNPGMFATFDYSPAGSRWSLFALITPRVWFYSDRNAVAVQDVRSCSDPETGAIVCDPRSNKPEAILSFNPSINYAISEKTGVRLGTTLTAAKYISSQGLQRDFMPFELGFTYDLDPRFSIYTYVLTSTGLDDSVRRNLYGISRPVSWLDTMSFNLWLSGTIL